jgi:hypothetical protein
LGISFDGFVNRPISALRFSALSLPRKFLSWILGVCWLCASGCAALVVGAGVGTGAYTYVNGELVRSYPARYSAAMAVCIQLLQDLRMPVKEQHSDGVQTTIVTERQDGTPMTIKVKIVGLEVTEISVRTGVVGYWNKDLSENFQEYIAERLKTAPAAGAAPS